MKAALGSLAVYLLPVAGPHVLLPFGFVLFAELTSERYRRETAWFLCDIALALALQAAAFGLGLAFVKWRRPLPRLFVLGSVPLLFFALQWLYLVAIPTHFLIEGDVSPQRTNWEIACRIDDAWLPPAEGAGIWLVSGDDAWASLTMPRCRVEPRNISTSETGSSDVSLTREGAMLFHRAEPAAGGPGTWFLPAGENEPIELGPPEDFEGFWNPSLAADGSAIAWTTRRRVDDVLEHEIFRRALPSGRESSFVMRGALPADLRIARFDPAASELFLASDREVMAVDLDGRLTFGPRQPEAHGGILRHPSGFVAWDTYRDEGRYRVTWSLLLGEGSHEVPKGRRITSVALDAWGRFIAISVSPSLSIGDVQDAVYVLRVDNGEEVFRRYLPAYTRSQLAFDGAHFLASTRSENGKRVVEVLRVPAEVPIERVRRFVSAYRDALSPVLSLFDELDAEGLGAEDCWAAGEASGRAARLPPAPDPVTADTVTALAERLSDAHSACTPFRPLDFAARVAEVESLMQYVEETLSYEHGLEAFPELSPVEPGAGYRIVPVGNGARARRLRS